VKFGLALPRRMIMSIIRKTFGVSSTSRLSAHSVLREELRGTTQIEHFLQDTEESLVENDESLIVDDRSAVSPAQMVENKLSRMLKDASVPVSHLQMRGLLRSR